MEAPTIAINDIKPGMLAEKPTDSGEAASLTEESLYPDRAILTSVSSPDLRVVGVYMLIHAKPILVNQVSSPSLLHGGRRRPKNEDLFSHQDIPVPSSVEMLLGECTDCSGL